MARGTRGVNPSSKETMLRSSSMGSASRYLHKVGFLVRIAFRSKDGRNRMSRKWPQSHFHRLSFSGYAAPHPAQPRASIPPIIAGDARPGKEILSLRQASYEKNRASFRGRPVMKWIPREDAKGDRIVC